MVVADLSISRNQKKAVNEIEKTKSGFWTKWDIFISKLTEKWT